MKADQYGQVTITEDEAFQALYDGKIKNFNNVLLNDLIACELFNQAVVTNADRVPMLKMASTHAGSIAEFDEIHQSRFFMPRQYLDTFDVCEWLHGRCNTAQEHARVDEEIPLFTKHGMFNLLKYLKFLVDTMRQENILWGVGRGSSVSSFVLYLIGVHRINPLKYDLNISEFLK